MHANAACSSCGAPLVAAPRQSGLGAPTAAPRDVTHGTVRGTLDGPSRWACPDGHEIRTPDVAAAVTEVTGALDVARRSRLRGTLRCGACDTPFALPGRRATRSVTLATVGVPLTRLTFDLPMLRCTEDAMDNMPPECLDDLVAVVTELLSPA